MSHLSALPHYFFVPPTPKGLPRALSRSSFLDTPVLTGANGPSLIDLPAENSAWTALGPYQQRAYLPQRLLPHPLSSAPQRYWGLAGGHQRIVSTSSAYLPPNRRSSHLKKDRNHLPEFTLRHYSTQRLACARPSTVNRFFHMNSNNFWTDKINWLLDDIGRISRSMKRWPSIRPEQRYMLRPLIPANLPHSVSMPDIAIRPQIPAQLNTSPNHQQQQQYHHHQTQQQISAQQQPQQQQQQQQYPLLFTPHNNHRPSPSSFSNSSSLHPPPVSSSSYVFNSSSSPSVAPFSSSTISSHVPSSSVKEVPIQVVDSLHAGQPSSFNATIRSPPSSAANLISEPRRHIHAYATQTPVSTLMETPEAPSAATKWATNGSGQWQRRMPKGGGTMGGVGGGDFARELRDAALTERQRAANLQQKSALKQSLGAQLPTSLHNYAYHQTVTSSTTTTATKSGGPTKNGGQEVDELIRDMELKMRSANATNKDTCTKCHQQIGGDPPGVTALGNPYHVTCFCCDACQKQLAGCSFYAVDGKNLCQVDYMNSLEKCDKCKMPITQKILRALSRAFHPECFACPICQKSLDGIPFTVDKENQAYCLECYHERFSPRCAACLKVIAPSGNETEVARVIAMDKSYHLDCYKCEDCGLKLNSKIEGQGCYPLEAHLFCKNCNLKRLKSIK